MRRNKAAPRLALRTATHRLTVAEHLVAAKMAGHAVKAYLRVIAAQERLATVKAQRDELADELDAWVQLNLHGHAMTPDEVEDTATLLARIRVAQACEQGPDHE